jgi:hypothetical protein
MTKFFLLLFITAATLPRADAAIDCYRIARLTKSGKIRIVSIPRPIQVSPHIEKFLKPLDEQFQGGRDQGISGRNFKIGKVLADSKDERRIQARLDMGHQWVDAEGQKFLVPASNWREFFDAIYLRADREVEEGLQVPFEVPSLLISDGGWRMYSPGLDPEPKVDSAELVILAEVGDAYWTDARAKGRLLYTTGYHLHDLGHIEESLVWPETRIAWINFHRQKKIQRGDENLPLSFDKLNYRYLNPERHPNALLHIQRYMIVSEFFSTPDLSQEVQIRERFPDVFALPPTINSESLAEYLKTDLNSEQLRARARRAIEAANFILPVGGAARDGFNRQKFLRSNEENLSYDLYDQIFSFLLGTSVRDDRLFDFTGKTLKTIIGQDLYGRLEMLKILESIESQPEAFQKLFKERNSAEPPSRKELEEKVFQLRAMNLARFEIGLKIGVELQITPESLVDSLHYRHVPRDHKVRQWITSFNPPESHLYKLFAKPAYREEWF